LESTDLQRGGVPGAERILAAWYADLPLPLKVIGEGEPGPGRGNKTGNNITRFDRGTGTEYTLRRLARDEPEILSKVQSGELTVNQAAIQAGIDRIALARKREDVLKPLAKENEKARKGKQAGSSLANLPNLPIDTRKESAKTAGVGERTYDAGKLILEAAAGAT
jgi:hypothetical protein